MVNIDEIPSTTDGLKIYIEELKKEIKPIEKILKRYNDQLKESERRLAMRAR